MSLPNYISDLFRLSSSYFVWTGNNGVCDVTDLPEGAMAKIGFCAEFGVVSERTGKTIVFHRERNINGCDGEFVGSRYVSAGGQYSVEIFND